MCLKTPTYLKHCTTCSYLVWISRCFNMFFLSNFMLSTFGMEERVNWKKPSRGKSMNVLTSEHSKWRKYCFPRAGLVSYQEQISLISHWKTLCPAPKYFALFLSSGSFHLSLSCGVEAAALFFRSLPLVGYKPCRCLLLLLYKWNDCIYCRVKIKGFV